jgi:hypothetical protein
MKSNGDVLKSISHLLFLKNKIHRQNQKSKTNHMVNAQRFIFKNHNRKKCKYNQRYTFLNYFQLPQSTIAGKPNLLNHGISLNFKCPYQASVINIFEIVNNAIE